ncbi:MAG: GNAT family N-acetyltransferase [Streptosporangiales bacterium]|nr:GNAT family N-acetyltransferase [Streptosporangiales bacterium]
MTRVRVLEGTAARASIEAAAHKADRPVFDSTPWYSAWWHSFGDAEQALALAPEGRAGWLVPLSLTREAGQVTLRSCGEPLADRHSVLGSGATLDRNDAAQIVTTLASLGYEVLMEGLSGDDPATGRVIQAMRDAGWHVEPEACPLLDARRRVAAADRRVRRFSRSFPEADVALIGGNNLTQTLVAEFLARRATRLVETGRWDDFPFFQKRPEFGERFTRLVLELAAKDCARILALRIRDWIVAEDLYIGPPERPVLYFRTYAPELARYSPGRTLLDHAVGHPVHQACHAIDLGRGGEPYKFDAGGDDSFVISASLPR